MSPERNGYAGLQKYSLRVLWLSVTDKLDSRRDKEAFEAEEAGRALAAAVQAHEDVRGRIAALEAQPGKRSRGAVWKVTRMRAGPCPTPRGRVCGALPRTPLKPFLKEGLKNPKNFQKRVLNKVWFTPNEIGGCRHGRPPFFKRSRGDPYPRSGVQSRVPRDEGAGRRVRRSRSPLPAHKQTVPPRPPGGGKSRGERVLLC